MVDVNSWCNMCICPHGEILQWCSSMGHPCWNTTVVFRYVRYADFSLIISIETCKELTSLQVSMLMIREKSAYLTIGGSRGAHPAHAPPPRVPILLFSHTKFLKHNRLGSPTPPPMRSTPPLREILDPPLLTYLNTHSSRQDEPFQ